MSVMAPRAVFLLNRAVRDSIVFQKSLHIGNATFAGHVLLIVTSHAQISRLHDQLLNVIRNMRIMAGKAFLFRIQALVFIRCCSNFLHFVFVAGEAEVLCPIGFEVVLEVAAMGVMTLHAGLFERSMGEFFVFKCFGFVSVALKANCGDGCSQQFGKLRLVNRMAGSAAADCSGTVGEFTLHDGAAVALEAEFSTCSTEHIFVWRLM